MEESIPVRVIQGKGAWNEKNKQTIIAYLFRGLSFKDAAHLVKITPQTLSDWMAEGERNLDDFCKYDCPLSERGEFYAECMYAKAKFRYKTLESMQEAFKTDKRQWVAVITALERMHPDEWGKQDTTKITGGGELKIKVQYLDGEAYKRGGKVIEEAPRFKQIEGER